MNKKQIPILKQQNQSNKKEKQMQGQCPICGGTFDVQPEWIGQEAECPHCQKSIVIQPAQTTTHSSLKVKQQAEYQPSPAQFNAPAKQTAAPQKKQTTGFFSLFFSKAFSFQGRATRKEFWIVFGVFIILYVLLGFLNVFLGLASVIDSENSAVNNILVFFGFLLLAWNVYLFFPIISVMVRRLHDLNLTGFWLWYLSPIGIAIIFIVHLLNLDNSCNVAVERISKVFTTSVSWLLLPFIWLLGTPCVLILLLLYKGKDETNEFGPSPY